MSSRTRKSKQRDRILELLENERIHVTANWVYDQLRKEFSALSLGNVYRNLNILVEQGEVNRLPFGSTFDVYEAARDPHCHFVCEGCGLIEDVPMPRSLQQTMDQAVLDETGHTVSRTTVEFHGWCRQCREQ
ncbi:MAG: transcriptional repressor [Spirochaetaceae bacterium]|nr:MAG: transcriptional repressor [Spirochaetaceae bacterium]